MKSEAVVPRAEAVRCRHTFVFPSSVTSVPYQLFVPRFTLLTVSLWVNILWRKVEIALYYGARSMIDDGLEAGRLLTNGTAWRDSPMSHTPLGKRGFAYTFCVLC